MPVCGLVRDDVLFWGLFLQSQTETGTVNLLLPFPNPGRAKNFSANYRKKRDFPVAFHPEMWYTL